MQIIVLSFILLFVLLLFPAISYYIFLDNFVRVDKNRRKGKKSDVASEFTSGIDWERINVEVERAKQEMLLLPHRDVYIESYDALKLHGLFFELEGAEKTLIAFHGYKSNKFTEFAKAFSFYRDRGFNVLLVDQRSHAESEGKYITFGVKERYDCLDWVRYVNSLTIKRQKIYLTGVSMGATTVEMAAGLDMPDNVRGIICDCGFTSPYDIVKSVGERMVRLPVAPILMFVDMWCRIIAGFSLKGACAKQALAKTEIPLFLIHGDSDNFVPFSMGQENFEACASKKMMFAAKGADHAMSYLVCHDEYVKKLEEFLNMTD